MGMVRGLCVAEGIVQPAIDRRSSRCCLGNPGFGGTKREYD